MFVEQSSDELMENSSIDSLKELFQENLSMRGFLEYYEGCQKSCSIELLKSFYPRSRWEESDTIKKSFVETKGNVPWLIALREGFMFYDTSLS
jgi:hypothetical protein